MLNPDKSEKLLSLEPFTSRLSLEGNNSVGFLNNLLISDLANLEENKCHFTALCNSKGRIITTFWIRISNQNKVDLYCANNMADSMLSYFNMRKFRQKISISQLSCDLILDKENCKILTDNTKHANTKASLEDYYICLFLHNLVWIDKNNTEQFIPQHVNLDLHDNIMSFSKGCYPGQEIIARIKYLGTVKKRMGLLKNNNKDELIKLTNQLEITSPIIYNIEENLFIIQAIKKTN